MKAALLLLTCLVPAEAPDVGNRIQVQETDDAIVIDTSALQAKIRKKGYVSGIAAGSLLDKKTGARELGYGLHIMDFLMAPGWRDDGYPRDPLVHGSEKKKGAAPGEPGFFDLSKHYIEGPQICTKARELKSEITRGKDFVAVKLRYRFTDPAPGFKAGSLWEQTLVFQDGLRYFLSGEQITSVNDVDDLFYRLDMPGHIKHRNGDTFTQVYLSYLDKPIPAEAFAKDFSPDAQVSLPAPARQDAGADDPGLPDQGGRQTGAVAGRPDTRSVRGLRGLVPSARLRLFHPGAASPQGQGRRYFRRRLRHRLL